MLEHVEAEARDIWQRGIRHIIWAGMGGSVLTVRVLRDLGFCGDQDKDQLSIYPLDSTDPAALNAIVREIAAARNLALPSGEEVSNPTFLRALLADVMMVGVAMGMTSEEPITHLEWFTDLLQQAGLRPAEHSAGDDAARLLSGPLCPRAAGAQPALATGRGNRHRGTHERPHYPCVPASRRPLSDDPFPRTVRQLRAMLQQTWNEYNLELATTHPAEHPFVQLAAALSAASRDGRAACS